MKGMHKIKRGTGFRGVLNYAFGRDDKHKEEPGRLVGGNTAGQTPRALAAEFGATRKLRPDIEKPVWHNSLRLPKGEALDDDQWIAIADDYMSRMGFTELNPRCYVLHDDEDGQHIHIVASRIALDGSLYLGKNENLASTKTIQQIERDHGLTITKGPEYVDGKIKMPDVKPIPKSEIERALRTGEEPPRQRLQRLLDEIIKDRPTAVELAERMTAAGVEVRANIARTGTMNGYSFSIGGASFAGGKLGDKYKWAGLLKNGVTYDKERDGEALRQYRPTATDRPSDNADAGDNAGATLGDSDRDIQSTGAAGDLTDGRAADTGSIRHSTSEPAADIGRAGHRDGGSSNRSTTEPDQEPHGAGEPTTGDREGYTENDGPYIPTTERPGQHVPQRSDSRTDAGERGRSAETPTVENSSNTSAGRNDRRSHSNGWADRFKRASAAKKRAQHGVGADAMEQRQPRTKVCDDADRIRAREIDPTSYLESRGYTVEQQGRHLSVLDSYYDEIYRGTQQADGHWVWCDHHQNGVGDNIALVKDIEGSVGFAEAVYQLTGAPTITPRQTSLPVPRVPPKLPTETRQSRDAGREYLRGRGISESTIKSAELDGMVHYCEGGVLFVGYDGNGYPQNATRRSINPADEIQKRDLKGSSKYYPPILSGSGTVWVVEGGADALALRDMAIRKKQPPPTVIVSGGANVRAFLQNPEVIAILTYSDRVIVACDNEKDDETQERTDAAHEAQAGLIAKIAGNVEIWKPRTGIKDIAELNQKTINQDVSTEQVKQQIRMD